MGKSFLERLARRLGKSTGKLVEKAKERGLDKKAGELVEKAHGRLKHLVKEYEEGQSEAKAAREAESAEGSPDGEQRAAEERSDCEGAGDEQPRREECEADGAKEPADARRGRASPADEPTGLPDSPRGSQNG